MCVCMGMAHALGGETAGKARPLGALNKDCPRQEEEGEALIFCVLLVPEREPDGPPAAT